MTTAQVYTQNGEQLIRLPADVDLDDGEVSVKRVGRSILLIPRDTDPWSLLIDSLDKFSDDYMVEREQPANSATNFSPDSFSR